MKIRFVPIVLLLLVALAPLSAATAAQIPLDSPIYQEMDTLYRLTGRPLPSSSRPWNTYEAIRLLEAIPSDGKYAALYQTIAARLEEESLHRADGIFAWRITPTINVESYVHTNSTDFKTYSDWMYSYDERKPMLDLDIAMQYGSTLYFATSAQVAVGAYSKEIDNPNNVKNTNRIGALFDIGDVIIPDPAYLYQKSFSTNIYGKGLDLEADFPRRSQLTIAGPWAEVTLGRGARKWGHGMTGDLIIGDHISNHTSLSASFFHPKTKIQLLYLFFTNYGFDDINRMFLGHRFEFQPLSWARFSISENIMVLVNELSPQFFDPTYIYHNVYDPEHANAIASLEAEFAITKGLSLHIQYALDQFQMPSEKANTANAMAGLANLSYSWPQQKGYWTAQAEFVMIDPAFYRRQKIDFLVARDLIKHQNDTSAVKIDYLGHRWGSDSLVYAASIGYYIPNLLDVAGSVTIHRQGEMTYTELHDVVDNGNDPIVNGPPPYGDTITDRLIISLSGGWQTPVKGLCVYGQIDWIGKRTYDTPTKSAHSHVHDFQFTAGVSKRF